MAGPRATFGRLTRGALARLGMPEGRFIDGRAKLPRFMLGRPTADRFMFPPKDGRDIPAGPRAPPMEGRPPPPPPPRGLPPRGAASSTGAANTRKATANTRCLFIVLAAVKRLPEERANSYSFPVVSPGGLRVHVCYANSIPKPYGPKYLDCRRNGYLLSQRAGYGQIAFVRCKPRLSIVATHWRRRVRRKHTFYSWRGEFVHRFSYKQQETRGNTTPFPIVRRGENVTPPTRRHYARTTHCSGREDRLP